MRRNNLFIILFLLLINFYSVNIVFGFDRGDVDIHGFVSQGYLRSSDNNYMGNSKDGSFQFNEIGISFSALLTDELRFGAQLFSHDLGEYGNNELYADWAYLDYSLWDWLGFRAGKIKMPYGFYNLERDADMLRTSILMPQSVYHEGLRDLVTALYGASLYGNIPMGDLGYIDYELFFGTIDVPVGTPYIKDNWLQIEYTNPGMYIYLTDVLGADPYTVEVVFKGGAGGKLVWNTPLQGLRLGVTDMYGEGEYGLGELVAELTVVETSVISVEYDSGDFTFSAERMKAESDVDVEGQTLTHSMEGYYGSIRWDVVKWATMGFSYGEYYPDAKDKDGEDIKDYIPDYWAWQKDIAISVRFNLSDYFCVKLETHFYDGVGLLSMENNTPPGDVEQNWILYAVKSSLNF